MKAAFLIACLVLSTVLMHLLADYPLQGILASMKQKSWWKGQTDDKMYGHDWIATLVCHSAMWGIMTAIPSLVTCFILEDWAAGAISILIMLASIVLHGFIDNEKANRHRINLVQDQALHLAQLLLLCVPACVAIASA